MVFSFSCLHCFFWDDNLGSNFSISLFRETSTDVSIVEWTWFIFTKFIGTALCYSGYGISEMVCFFVELTIAVFQLLMFQFQLNVFLYKKAQHYMDCGWSCCYNFGIGFTIVWSESGEVIILEITIHFSQTSKLTNHRKSKEIMSTLLYTTLLTINPRITVHHN